MGTFQMGATLFEALSGGGQPYPCMDEYGGNYYLDTSAPFNEAALAGYPEDVVEFLKAMVDPDPSKRPTGDAIRKGWEEIVEKHGGLEQLAKTAETARLVETAKAEEAKLVETAKYDLWDLDVGRLDTELDGEKCLEEEGEKFIMRTSFTENHGKPIISGKTKGGEFVHISLDHPTIVDKLKEGKEIHAAILEILGY